MRLAASAQGQSNTADRKGGRKGEGGGRAGAGTKTRRKGKGAGGLNQGNNILYQVFIVIILITN